MSDAETMKVLEEIKDLQQRQLDELRKATQRYLEVKEIAAKQSKVAQRALMIIVGLVVLVFVWSLLGSLLRFSR
jgi:hypothetical protein